MTDQEAIARKLEDDATYRAMFREAFGDAATGLRIRQALASYLRVLKTGDSPYDRFVAGDGSALSEQAKRGLATFRAFGCASCHSGPLFSDFRFHNVGVGCDPAGSCADAGRFEVTKDPADRGRFRTPPLRDVARTGPWFHDGSSATLDDAIARMARGADGADPLLVRHTPTASELADLRAFLEALSGVWTLEAPRVLPGGRPRS